MVFASFIFLFVFFPALMLCHQFTPQRYRNATVLAFSYLFYGWWRADLCLLLFACTVVDYFTARRIYAAGANLRRRRAWLAVSVTFNLGLLGYFKYANFGVATFNQLLAASGHAPLGWEAVILPVGISFITFQTMSYTIDVYRGDVTPASRIADFATYVALFPQLVAGPIVRYRTVAKELASRTISRDRFAFGVMVFVIGFNKKILLANNFALLADEAFSSVAPGFAGAWCGLLAYTLQIYFDFSGYSDMAMGLGAMIGFEFPINFDSPYRSKSITEFWRRWHITLSTWIRDYLYVSLGGNRVSRAKTYRNLALSMLLCGLWHGANWTFIAWGAFHAVWLIAEKVSGRRSLFPFLPAPLQTIATVTIVAMGWVLFRAEDIGAAERYLRSLVAFGDGAWSPDAHWVLEPSLLALMLLGWGIAFFGKSSFAISQERSLGSIVLSLGLFAVALAELLSQGFSPFLYFQF